ncbi:MAG: thioredoxin [Clostridiales bacterium]|nr:MAG: thioredoxin [Clostridiales bacterium]
MANQNVIMLNEDNFRQEVLKSEMPVLVDFWAAWCGPCKMVGPIVEELANDYAGKAKVCKLNVDDCGRIAQSYGVMSIPTLILFKDGQEANRIVGFRPKAELAKLLEG